MPKWPGSFKCQKVDLFELQVRPSLQSIEGLFEGTEVPLKITRFN